MLVQVQARVRAPTRRRRLSRAGRPRQCRIPRECGPAAVRPERHDSSGTDLTLDSTPVYGALTLSGLPFQGNFGDAVSGKTGPTDYNSPVQAPEISILSR